MIQINWQNADKTILTWTFSDTWTAAEYFAAKTKYQQMMIATKYDVLVIVDLSEGQGPEDLFEIAADAFRIPVSNVKQVAIVGYLPTWKSLWSIFTCIKGEPIVSVHFVKTLQQAKQMATPKLNGIAILNKNANPSTAITQ
ncbi:MAG: hypothetical protein AAFY41_19850 [Bacteroidota bacterium]